MNNYEKKKKKKKKKICNIIIDYLENKFRLVDLIQEQTIAFSKNSM